MDIDSKNIEALLDQGKYDEVRALVDQAVTAQMTPAQKGATLTDFASLYMDVVNSINERYRKTLEEVLEGMKALNKAESQAKDNVRMQEVRSDFNAK